MSRKKYDSLEIAARREEALRPCEGIGYDRDTLGAYFLEREAYKLAESQFARAAWLNPYEPLFKVHHALALLQLKDAERAKFLLKNVLQHDSGPAVNLAIELWQKNWPKEEY
jgi:hypothetical protein